MSEAETPAAAPAEGEEAAAEVEEAAVEAPVEGAAPVEGEQTEAVEVEGEEKPPEEAKPEDEKAAITEEALRVAAVRFANKTMAAARRAEQRTETVKQQNEQLSSSLKLHTDFIQELRTSPLTAIRKLGFQSVRDFLDAGINAGGEPKAPDPVDEVKSLREEIRQEREKATREAQVAAIDNVIATKIDADKKTFARTATKHGKNVLWGEIAAYHKLHGSCPTAAVVQLANIVERDLRSEFGDPVFAPPAGAKTPAPAPDNAAPGARNGGKTLTNKQTSSAPATREYSLDPDERRRQVTEDMRAAGEL